MRTIPQIKDDLKAAAAAAAAERAATAKETEAAAKYVPTPFAGFGNPFGSL